MAGAGAPARPQRTRTCVLQAGSEPGPAPSTTWAPSLLQEYKGEGMVKKNAMDPPCSTCHQNKV